MQVHISCSEGPIVTVAQWIATADSTAGGGMGYVKNITFEDFYGGCFVVTFARSEIECWRIQSMTLTIRSSSTRSVVDVPRGSETHKRLVQCYMTDAATCAEYPSQLSISDVHCTSRIISHPSPARSCPGM